MTAVTAIPALEHDEAMVLAEAELGRVLALVDDSDADDWARPTDCTGWIVRDPHHTCHVPVRRDHRLGAFSAGSGRSACPSGDHGAR